LKKKALLVYLSYMKYFTPPRIIILSLILAATVLIYLNYFMVAGFVSLACFMVGSDEFKKHTGTFAFITLFIDLFLLGMATEGLRHGFPFICVAILGSGIALSGRILFMKYLGYSRALWFEPLLFAASLSLYIYGNIAVPAGWATWMFPLLPFGMAAYVCIGSVFGGIRLLKASRQGYKVESGKPAPDFSLADHAGETVTLSEFNNKRAVLLIFVRGDWCPGCHMMLRTYEKERTKFQQKNIMVMAIGPDPVGVNRDMVKRLELDFKVLSDEKQLASQIYGVQDPDGKNKDRAAGIPLPASFLVDLTGVVRYTSRPDRVGEFLNPSTIFPILESIHHS
jgi:peroxiredoxin